MDMSGGGSSTLVNRMIRASRLDASLYEEVENDRTATSQAATVVIIVAIASAIGNALNAAINNAPAGLIGGIIGGVIFALLMWLVWAYLTYFVGTRFFGGSATPGEMLRTIGFASSPGLLGILVFIPVLGPIISFVVGIWSLVAGVVAVRQALDFTTGKAIATAVISWLIPFVLFVVLGGLLLGVFMAGLGLGGATGSTS
jgi:hypothetical protein